MPATDKRKPWFKFYVDSWRADELLRMCSLQARGMWVEMLAIMHKATPYGHLLVNGRQMRLDDLARLVGVPMKEAKDAIEELERKSVFSRTEDGTVYSRKMVRDEVASQEGRDHIRKRFPVRGDDNEPTSPPNRVPGSEAKSTEDRGQKEKPEAKASGKKKAYPLQDDFGLTDKRRAVATDKGIIDAELEFTRFCDDARANRRTYADWDAAWRNWCNSPYQASNPNSNRFRGQRSGSPRGGSLVGAMRAVTAAYGQHGLRTDGVQGHDVHDGRAAQPTEGAFEVFDQAFGEGVRQPGGDTLPLIDQEPGAGRG